MRCVEIVATLHPLSRSLCSSLSSVCDIQLLVRNSAQNFINVRETGEREREKGLRRWRELLDDCGINFHATNYGRITGTCPVRV